MAIVLCILGVFCVFYGVTVMLVGSGTWFFAVWYVLAVCFFAAAGIAHVLALSGLHVGFIALVIWGLHSCGLF